MQKEINFKALFGSHRKGHSEKTGRDYNFMELSDGFKASILSTELEKSETNDLVQGDEVNVTVIANILNPSRTKIVGIRKV